MTPGVAAHNIIERFVLMAGKDVSVNVLKCMKKNNSPDSMEKKYKMINIENTKQQITCSAILMVMGLI